MFATLDHDESGHLSDEEMYGLVGVPKGHKVGIPPPLLAWPGLLTIPCGRFIAEARGWWRDVQDPRWRGEISYRRHAASAPASSPAVFCSPPPISPAFLPSCSAPLSLCLSSLLSSLRLLPSLRCVTWRLWEQVEGMKKSMDVDDDGVVTKAEFHGLLHPEL